MSRQRPFVSRGVAIFGVVVSLIVATLNAFVAIRHGAWGLRAVSAVVCVGIAGGWLRRYRQTVVMASSSERPESGA